MFNLYFNLLILLIMIESFVVILAKNPVVSVIHLILVYILTAFLFIYLGAEFIGILVIIVYVGAVSILFLFVVMMLNLRIFEVVNSLKIYLPIGLFVAIGFLVILFSVLTKVEFYLYLFPSSLFDISDIHLIKNNTNIVIFSFMSNLSLIADLLFNGYAGYIYSVTGILLLAMLGSIVLTVDFRKNLETNISTDLYKKKSKKRFPLKLNYYSISLCENTA